MALGRRRLAIVCVQVEGGGCVNLECRRRLKFSKWLLEAEALERKAREMKAPSALGLLSWIK